MIKPIPNLKQEHDRTIFFMSSLTLLLFQVKVKVKVKVKTLILRLCCSLKLVLTHTSLRQPAQVRNIVIIIINCNERYIIIMTMSSTTSR